MTDTKVSNPIRIQPSRDAKFPKGHRRVPESLSVFYSGIPISLEYFAGDAKNPVKFKDFNFRSIEICSLVLFQASPGALRVIRLTLR